MISLFFDIFDTPIEISTEYVSILSFEDIHLYAKVIRSLHFLCNGEDGEMNIWALDGNGKLINMTNVEVITDPLAIDFTSRKILAGLVNRLKNCLNTDVDTFCDIETKFQELQYQVKDVLSDFSLPLIFDNKWDAGRIIKALSISVDSDCCGLSHLDILNKYLDISEELDVANFHCFVGLNQFLTDEELDIFYQNVLRVQIPIICIQHSETLPSPNPSSKVLHIDKDFDEIFINNIDSARIT